MNSIVGEKRLISEYNESKAIDVGAELISEMFLLSVGGVIVLYEVTTSSHNEERKKKELADKFIALETALLDQQQQLEMLRTRHPDLFDESHIKKYEKHLPSEGPGFVRSLVNFVTFGLTESDYSTSASQVIPPPAPEIKEQPPVESEGLLKSFTNLLFFRSGKETQAQKAETPKETIEEIHQEIVHQEPPQKEEIDEEASPHKQEIDENEHTFLHSMTKILESPFQGTQVGTHEQIIESTNTPPSNKKDSDSDLL